MSDYLLVTDNIAPLSDTPEAIGALGLASALASAGHSMVILSQASPAQLAQQTGLARRLRPVSVTLGKRGGSFDVPLYEGRLRASAANVFVLAVEPGKRGWTSALLGAAAQTLVQDGTIRAAVLVGWGEGSATALADLTNARRVFVVASGRPGAALDPQEVELLSEHEALDVKDSLLGRAAIDADAVVVPSPAAAAEIAAHPALADRASDQPLVVLPFGCDDPPHDPNTDPALPHHYSASAPAGKSECRKSLARRLTLSVGPRTLLVLAPRLTSGPAADTLLTALSQLGGLDIAVILPAGTDRALTERARVLAIQNPGRMALVEETADATTRELRAAADAEIFIETHDQTGRPAGLARRYGTLPIAPDSGAFGDFLIDYDARSATGTALLYAPQDPFELLGALQRAITLRADRERWDALVVSLLTTAPSWRTTATRLESLCAEPIEKVSAPLMA
jgi:hypothetical protein